MGVAFHGTERPNLDRLRAVNSLTTADLIAIIRARGNVIGYHPFEEWSRDELIAEVLRGAA